MVKERGTIYGGYIRLAMEVMAAMVRYPKYRLELEQYEFVRVPQQGIRIVGSFLITVKGHAV